MIKALKLCQEQYKSQHLNFTKSYNLNDIYDTTTA